MSNPDLARAILRTFESPNICDGNFEPANLVDVVAGLSQSAQNIANAIKPHGAADGRDAAGGSVSSLTESVMGVTAGLFSIASAIELLAAAVHESRVDKR